MRRIRIYQSGLFEPGETIELSQEAGHHVSVVLRMRVGEQLMIFSGDNREFDAQIVALKKNQVSVSLGSVTQVNRESPLRLHLAQGISKGQRMETVVQKAVELGVSSITPIITAHCAVKITQEYQEKKSRQWQGIAIAACEQSGRTVVPLIHPMQSLSEYIKAKPDYPRLLLDPTTKENWRAYADNHTELGLLIGPEGGLSGEEMSTLLAQGFLPLRLGPRVLRTETAAIVALSVLQAVCGDL